MMLTPVIWKKLLKAEQVQLLQRPCKKNKLDLAAKTAEIIARVRAQGDLACKELTQELDGVALTSLEVQQSEFENARLQVKDSTKRALLRVIEQLNAFHLPQMIKELKIETSSGVTCQSLPRPIERVGLYIPGGSAALVSTVLMLAVPAQIANCPMRVLCSPPRKEGTIDPAILFAAELCGITKIYKLGGAQAIAALAYGTETIPKVNKIFGPGNAWVTQAKILVSQETAGAVYDLPAGPSEVMVIADRFANAEFAAADLLAQAEHGPDSQVILLATDIDICNKVIEAVKRQLRVLSRNSIIEQALKNSRFIVVESISTALDLANDYAPEHLILQIEEPRFYLDQIQNAGSLFLGPWSPEAAGDYASGTNHVLPTDGFAKSLSGLSMRDFMKTISVQELSKEGLNDLAETIRELAAIEGLDAHKNAIDIRLEGLSNAK